MDVVRPDRAQAGPPERPEYVAGTVRLQYLRRPAPGGMELIAVFFDPGARTIPHVHHAEQVLVFVEGEGVVATEDGRRVVRAGQIAVIPAGAWHWHGATRTSPACHISIKAAGPTDWTVERRDWDDY